MANMTTRTIDGVTYWLLNITDANNPSGYAEKLLTASTFVDKSILVSVPSAVASSAAEYEALAAIGSSSTTVSSQYFKITPSYSVTTAGWISSGSVSGTATNYDIKNATLLQIGGTTSNTGIAITGSGGGGWIPSSIYLDGIDTGNDINFSHGSGGDINKWTIQLTSGGTLTSKINVNYGSTALVTNGVVVTGTLAAPTVSINNITGNVITAQQFTLTATSKSGNAGFINANASGDPSTKTYAVQLADVDYTMTNLAETTTAGTYQMNSDTATIFADVSKTGWIGTDLPTITIKAPTVQQGSLSNAPTSGVSYTELSGPVLDQAHGYKLYINEGYYAASWISLGTLAPDLDPEATSDKLLTGYSAYDGAGNIINGTMLNKGTATITSSTSGTNLVFSISNFQIGYYSAQTPASVPIYQGTIEEIAFTVTLSDNGDGSYDVYDGQDATGTHLATVRHGQPATTVTCRSGYLYLHVVESFSGVPVITGSITQIDHQENPDGTLSESYTYQVTGDGTISASSYW